MVSLFRILVVAVMTMSPWAAHAEAICSGKIHTLHMRDGDGVVSVDFGYGVVHLCSVLTEVNSVAPGKCQAINDLLLGVLDGQRTLSLVLPNIDSCSRLEDWKFFDFDSNAVSVQP